MRVLLYAAPLLIWTAASTAQDLRSLRTIAEVSYINSDYALGYAMLGLGDVNADGKPDFAVSARNIITTFVYLGGEGVLDSLPDLSLKGGGAIAKGDLNGDGLTDLVLTTRDSLLVYFGNHSSPIAIDTIPGLTISGLGINSWWQTSLAVGDLNGDGFDDLVVGYPFTGLDEGSGFAFMGCLQPSATPNYVSVGDTFGSQYGIRVAVGDVNGDSVDDLAISSDDRRGFQTVDIFYGEYGWDFDRSRHHQRLDSREYFLSGLAHFDLVDVNVDDMKDVSFGSGDSTVILLGRPDSISHALGMVLRNPDPAFFAGFQHRASNIGDIDGDGKMDFAMRLAPGGPAVCLVVYLGGSVPHPVAGRCRGFVGTAFEDIVELGDMDGDSVCDFGVTAPYDALLQPPQDGCFVILAGDRSLTVAVHEEVTVPESRSLMQNYPNPFNPHTTIEYRLTTSAHVLLVISDQTGREVRKLVDERQDVGIHLAFWDGKAATGRSIASGVYYYTLFLDGIARKTKQALMVK